MAGERSGCAGLDRKTHQFDVCVVGGGMAGLCAAIASARNGAKTALVHERPVLGGNASSEIRMWICGAHGVNNKETGILEEIQLENCYRNPTGIYSIWDSVLYEKAAFCPNLTLFLNTTCTDGHMEGEALARVTAWQMTSQTWHTIGATLFIDCSGDSILAPLSGATVRVGRESGREFGEDIEPLDADRKTMGNSLLLQLRETDEPQPFIPPRWAYKFKSPSDLPHRLHGDRGDNFWWMELGGLCDTIADAETIRHELMCVGYGVWDYFKNHSPKRDKTDCWALEWMGSLPGKRESRRYVGDHVLTQNDVRSGGKFDDIIAYGGWSMDDHHPAGLLYPGRPTIFHPAPSPYGIPYRSLYSINIPNLLFAGRNISVTHAALSSTRVMATCSLLGQAAGTAAALCIRHRCNPRDLYPGRISELQQTLMGDDLWLPGFTRQASPLSLSASSTAPGQGASHLCDGHDRPIGEHPHAWTGPLGTPLTFTWNQAVSIEGLRLVLDSDLNQHKRMPCSYPRKGNHCAVPATLLRSFSVQAKQGDGAWTTILREDNNYQRLLQFPMQAQTSALRIIPESTWGSPEATLFSIDVLDHLVPKQSSPPQGLTWPEVVARVPAIDLRPPHTEEVAASEGEK